MFHSFQYKIKQINTDLIRGTQKIEREIFFFFSNWKKV